jgi:F-type H+-transporting ATPase subunit b
MVTHAIALTNRSLKNGDMPRAGGLRVFMRGTTTSRRPAGRVGRLGNRALMAALCAGSGVLALPVAVFAQEAGHAEGGGGAALFDINVGLSLWTVVVFLALLAILWKFAWGPILGAVQAREDHIQQALDESERQRKEAEALLEQHRQHLAEARRHAQEIIAEGKTAGAKVRKEIEEKARDEGDALLERARADIQREKDEALAEIRKETVQLALAAASKLMGERLDSERDRQLVLGYVDELASASEEASA